MYKHQELTQKVIKAGHNVHNELGCGFVEKVDYNAMVLELHKTGLEAVSGKPISMRYDGQTVGEYVADIIVDKKAIFEIKAFEAVNRAHKAQLVNYLRATNIDVGLLLNFGKSLEVKRKIFETARRR